MQNSWTLRGSTPGTASEALATSDASASSCETLQAGRHQFRRAFRAPCVRVEIYFELGWPVRLEDERIPEAELAFRIGWKEQVFDGAEPIEVELVPVRQLGHQPPR